MKRWMWGLAAAFATAGTVATASTVQADEKNEHETPVSIDNIPKRQGPQARDGGQRKTEAVSARWRKPC